MASPSVRLLLLVGLLCAAAAAVEAETVWAVALDNGSNANGSSFDSSLALSSMYATPFSATLSTSAGAVGSQTVNPGGTALFPMMNPIVGSQITSDGVYRLTFNGLGHAVQYSTLDDVDSNDASSLLSLVQLGTTYRAQTFGADVTPPGPVSVTVGGISIGGGSGGMGGTTVTVVGTQDNTMVTFVPSADTTAGPNLPAMTAGTTYTYTLDAFEAMHVASNHDLTASFVQSTLPVAVFAGSPCTDAGTSACDHLQEQMKPLGTAQTVTVACTTAWARGPQAGEVPLPTEYVRVLAAASGTTTVTIAPTGSTFTLSGLGDWEEFGTDTDLVITSTQPVFVSQVWANSGATDGGDPSLILPHALPWASSYHAMYAPPNWTHQTITVAATTLTPFTIDGALPAAASIHDIPGTLFRCISQDVTPGTHVVQTSPLDQVGVTMFGWGQAASYWFASNCQGPPIPPPAPPIPPVVPPVLPDPTPPAPTPTPAPPPAPPVAPTEEAAREDGEPFGGAQDSDRDGISDEQDNCPMVANSLQLDVDRDGMGDVCDELAVAAAARLPTLGRQAPVDADADGEADMTDDCPHDADPLQEDLDRDGLGDACDVDADGDLVADIAPAGFAADNCPRFANQDQLDADGDGIGNVCDKAGAGTEPLAAEVSQGAGPWREGGRPTWILFAPPAVLAMVVVGAAGYVRLRR